jgi:methyl-accepting chemotaxis protein
VRLGAGNDPDALAQRGQNPEVRARREALQAAFDGFAQRNKARIADIQVELDQFQARVYWIALAAVVGGLLLGLILASIIAMLGIDRPLSALSRRMASLAEGEIGLEPDGQTRRDEIGDMARSVGVFRDAMARAASLDAEKTRDAAAHDARRQQLETLSHEFGVSIDQVVGTVAAAAGTLSERAGALDTAAGHTQARAATVATAAAAASGNVQTVAAAAEELNAAIAEITRRMTETAGQTRRAADEANGTLRIMNGLSEAAQRIGDVVQLITAIAAQTNLLALNATIEAARAGEAGKGFAVVASEVKSMAAQTGQATEDIQGQVGAIQEETKRAVAAIGAIAATVEAANGLAGAVAHAIEQQDQAARKIARNIQQVAGATHEVSGTIAEVSHSAGDTTAAASAVRDLAQVLDQQGDRLRREVASFLARLSA